MGEYDNDMLGNADEACSWCEGLGEILKWVMLIVFFVLMIYPTLAIVLIVLIATLAGNAVWRVWIPWCCGVFVGAVTAFFFHQTVQALLYAANTMFVAIAIDKATAPPTTGAIHSTPSLSMTSKTP